MSRRRSEKVAEWTPTLLATTAPLWAWQSLGKHTSRFDEARAVTAKLYADIKVPATYQSFVKALAFDSSALLEANIGTLRRRMGEVASSHWTVGRWCVLPFDGTRFCVPHTADRSLPQAGLNESGLDPHDLSTAAAVRTLQRALEHFRVCHR